MEPSESRDILESATLTCEAALDFATRLRILGHPEGLQLHHSSPQHHAWFVQQRHLRMKIWRRASPHMRGHGCQRIEQAAHSRLRLRRVDHVTMPTSVHMPMSSLGSAYVTSAPWHMPMSLFSVASVASRRGRGARAEHR